MALSQSALNLIQNPAQNFFYKPKLKLLFLNFDQEQIQEAAFKSVECGNHVALKAILKKAHRVGITQEIISFENHKLLSSTLKSGGQRSLDVLVAMAQNSGAVEPMIDSINDENFPEEILKKRNHIIANKLLPLITDEKKYKDLTFSLLKNSELLDGFTILNKAIRSSNELQDQMLFWSIIFIAKNPQYKSALNYFDKIFDSKTDEQKVNFLSSAVDVALAGENKSKVICEILGLADNFFKNQTPSEQELADKNIGTILSKIPEEFVVNFIAKSAIENNIKENSETLKIALNKTLKPKLIEELSTQKTESKKIADLLVDKILRNDESIGCAIKLSCFTFAESNTIKIQGDQNIETPSDLLIDLSSFFHDPSFSKEDLSKITKAFGKIFGQTESNHDNQKNPATLLNKPLAIQVNPILKDGKNSEENRSESPFSTVELAKIVSHELIQNINSAQK